VNSHHHDYTATDRSVAVRFRGYLIKTDPDVMNTQQFGQHPNDAMFHAEATVLLRTASANGGSLAGHTLRVVTDKAMCSNCKMVLPRLALQLGDPRVIFVDPNGKVLEMRNGKMTQWTSHEEAR
jgi:hypothetical protein